MVWGMPLPESYGEFWPSGDFEYDPKTQGDGWFARLRTYFEEQMPEDQKRMFEHSSDAGNAALAYSVFPASKFKKEPGALDKHGVKPAYGPIEPHEVPRSYDTKRSHQLLGSLIKFHSKIIGIDGALKAIIEKFEPGIHEFFRLKIRMPKGRSYSDSYYVLRIGQYFDAFSREDSWEGSVHETPAWEPEPGVLIPPFLRLNETKKAINGLAMRKAVFGEAHLWRDRQFGEELTCFSETLIAEVERAGLRIPKYYKMREV